MLMACGGVGGCGGFEICAAEKADGDERYGSVFLNNLMSK